jgi:hypothetical protein
MQAPDCREAPFGPAGHILCSYANGAGSNAGVVMQQANHGVRCGGFAGP